MAAKIGILGESTSLTIGSFITVYTVPSDKAARVHILYAVEGNGTMSFTLKIGAPGSEQVVQQSGPSGEDIWSGSLDASTPDPALSYLAGNIGNHVQAAQFDMDNAGALGPYWIAPLPIDYFLSTGDTVGFQNSNTEPLDCLVQVIGVEDDA
jgi:hypothetical protein